MSEYISNQPILNAVAATGVGAAMNVKDKRHVIIELSTAAVGSGDSVTVKFAASNSEACPNFAASQSSSNIWDYIQVIDLEDGSPIDGDTGITIADANDVRRVEIQSNGANWINVEVVSVTGTLTVSASGSAYLD